MVPPLITLEEHFFSTGVMNTLEKTYAEQFKHLPELSGKLRDLENIRLKDMDAGAVTFQIISHGPGAPNVSQCHDANEQLAAAVKQHPDRFAGFAVLPIEDPQQMASELDRCVKEFGFVGALIDNHTHDGKFFDGPDYHVFWAKAAELDVAIYLHPAWPTSEMRQLLFEGPGISAGASDSIGSSGYGWHASVAVHYLRLFASGLFDRHPKLKIILGHFGEMIPFNLTRIIALSKRWGPRERDFKTVWDQNVFVTTSGVWSLDPLVCMLRQGNTKIENILYSVDYPFAKNEDGLKWVKELEESGLLTKEQFEALCYGNAERVLGLKVNR